MAQTPNGKPRPISEQAADVYAERRRREALVEQAKADATNLIPDWDQHPDLAESLIPVWGSVREAVADVHDGDKLGAALNMGLALTDIGGGWTAKALGKTMLKAASKDGSKVGLKRAIDPNRWELARKRMVENGYLQKGQDGHHWLITQNGFLGKKVPTAIKNQPWNIKPMPNNPKGKQMHGRITNAYTLDGIRKERFNALDRYIVGTPTWWKFVNAGAIGHPAGAAKAEWDKSSR